ncbi:hypothetical protein [Amycolatopsis sp. NPDC049159]|uniref:hypothetical protein n=1 Tax=Amycolatopsis sp. NPDC049159 TaxID=3157210 RepID=UPI0033D32BA7
MDRSPQDPVDPAEPAESPLSFPVEAPRPAGLEPGAGAQAGEPARPSPPAPWDFPVEPPRPPATPVFPADASHPQPSLPAPFPVAQLPGLPLQPAQPEPAQPGEDPAPAPAAGVLRFLPAALSFLAALLTVAGTLLPLFRVQEHLSVRQRSFETRLVITQTAWGTSVEIPGQDATDRAGAPLGVPLVLAAVLLFAAAFVAFSRTGRGRLLIGAAAVFTAGVVTTVGMNRFELSALVGDVDLEVVTATGMWLLILAAAVAVAAAVVAHLPLRNRDWADPAVAYADTPTPPSGVAITVLPPEEPEQPGQPG